MTIVSRRFHLASVLLFVVAGLGTSGCNIESIWKVPTFPGERASGLWSSDPRTTGWNGVAVEYALLTNGGVDATISSGDGKHQFKKNGKFWHEDERGERFASYEAGRLLVVEFDGRQERYRFANPPGAAWGHLVLVEPSAPDSQSAASTGTPQQAVSKKGNAIVGSENQGDAAPPPPLLMEPVRMGPPRISH